MSDSTKDNAYAPAEQPKQNDELDLKQLDNVRGGYGTHGGGGGGAGKPTEGLLPAV